LERELTASPNGVGASASLSHFQEKIVASPKRACKFGGHETLSPHIGSFRTNRFYFFLQCKRANRRSLCPTCGRNIRWRKRLLQCWNGHRSGGWNRSYYSQEPTRPLAGATLFRKHRRDFLFRDIRKEEADRHDFLLRGSICLWFLHCLLQLEDCWQGSVLYDQGIVLSHSAVCGTLKEMPGISGASRTEAGN
jgi:hypothetical protein